LKPSVIMVRCVDCGRPHEEYFGPSDRDEQKAEIELLRKELAAAAAILARPTAPKRAKMRHARHRQER